MIEFISLISGSSGNATYISDGRTSLLIDCGMSGARLKDALRTVGKSPEDIDALLITHEHIDHTRGAGVVSRRYNLPIYATKGTISSMDAGRIAEENIHTVKADEEIEIGSFGVKPFAIPHDAKEPVGFTLFSGCEKYALATDIGKMNGDIISRISGSRCVILESNHDIDMLNAGSYPFPLKQRILGEYGHLSNRGAALSAAALAESGTEHIMLGHLSVENNRPEIAMLETYNLLTERGVNVGKDVTLQVADRYNITRFKI